MMGRHYWNKRSEAGIGKAIECFRKAIAADVQYARAYAGLADCYAAQAWFEMGPPAQLWEQAYKETQKALELDSARTEVLATDAFRKAAYEWKWKDSEAGFRKAIGATPQYATARHWYGIFCLASQRRLRAAKEEMMRACTMDPLSPAIGTHLGSILYFQRAYREAAEQCLRALELDPSFHLAYWHLGFIHVQLSQFDDAFAAFRQAEMLGCSEPVAMGSLAFCHASAGNRPEATRLLDSLQRRSSMEYVSPVAHALIHAALGNTGEAFQYLDAAVQERSCRLIHVKVEPGFDKLKTDPRFIRILSTIDLL
jgi:tetratricopeptide (TPR) repeat protein